MLNIKSVLTLNAPAREANSNSSFYYTCMHTHSSTHALFHSSPKSFLFPKSHASFLPLNSSPHDSKLAVSKMSEIVPHKIQMIVAELYDNYV